MKTIAFSCIAASAALWQTVIDMICPHCHKEIPDAAVAKHLAAKGGAKAKGAKKRRSAAHYKRLAQYGALGGAGKHKDRPRKDK